jgi:hypothetical protein
MERWGIQTSAEPKWMDVVTWAIIIVLLDATGLAAVTMRPGLFMVVAVDRTIAGTPATMSVGRKCGITIRTIAGRTTETNPGTIAGNIVATTIRTTAMTTARTTARKTGGTTTETTAGTIAETTGRMTAEIAAQNTSTTCGLILFVSLVEGVSPDVSVGASIAAEGVGPGVSVGASIAALRTKRRGEGGSSCSACTAYLPFPQKQCAS